MSLCQTLDDKIGIGSQRTFFNSTSNTPEVELVDLWEIYIDVLETARGLVRLSSLVPDDRLGNEAVRGAPFAQCSQSSFPTSPNLCITSYTLPSSQSIMSRSPAPTAASSSSRFQAIFQAALKSHQRQTKNDLLAHPLASQLQDCDSTNAIITILQDQVQQFDKSRSGDERLTKWLGPTVNVLNAFSATISSGVSLVSLHS